MIAVNVCDQTNVLPPPSSHLSSLQRGRALWRRQKIPRAVEILHIFLLLLFGNHESWDSYQSDDGVVGLVARSVQTCFELVPESVEVVPESEDSLRCRHARC